MTPYRLPDRPGPTPFRVPEGMLDTVHERVLARSRARRSKWRFALRVTSAAAVLAALVTVAISYMYRGGDTHTDDARTDYIAAFDVLSDDDRDAYVATYQDDIFLQTYQTPLL